MSEEMRREMEDIKTVNRRIIATLVRLEGKMDDMSERMATKDDLAKLESRVYERLDEMSAVLEDVRDRVAIHAARRA